MSAKSLVVEPREGRKPLPVNGKGAPTGADAPFTCQCLSGGEANLASAGNEEERATGDQQHQCPQRATDAAPDHDER